MKKFVFLFGLLITSISLTACGSKNFNMSFDEALEIANHSELQEILAGNENFEQSFDIAGNLSSEWNKIDANILTTSKQNINNNKSESSIKFNANITTQWETMKLDWVLDLKLVDDTVYLNLWTLDLTWSDNLAMIGMMVEWFKGQWLSIPMTGLSGMPSTLSYFKDSEVLNAKAKEIINNEWSTVYNWKFKQFNGYNAWKFSIDNEKLNTLVKEYYDSMSSGLDLGSGEDMEFPEINIQNFEWYLVITWKDKVTTVIESVDVVDNDIVMSVNWFAGKDYEINIAEWEEELIKIVANKKSSKYDVSISVSDAILLNWTISPKLSKSEIKLNFDAKLTVKAQNEWDSDTIIPFKGSWNYVGISDFDVLIPEDAQDLTELLWAYLGDWWSDEDYEALYDENSLNLDEPEATEETENITESSDTNIETLEPDEAPATTENE